MLRRALLVLGVVGLLLSGAGLLAGGGPAVLEFFLLCAIFTAAILFERWRYIKRTDRTAGSWQPTGERFADPVTGAMTEVYYNPDTGERDYRPAGK